MICPLASLPIFENNLSNCFQINHYFTTGKISKHKRLAEHMDRSASEPLGRVTLLLKLWIIGFLHSVLVLHFHFTLRAFSRLFYPRRLTLCTFIRRKRNNNISLSSSMIRFILISTNNEYLLRELVVNHVIAIRMPFSR